jgi:hypothetical protein
MRSGSAVDEQEHNKMQRVPHFGHLLTAGTLFKMAVVVDGAGVIAKM